MPRLRVVRAARLGALPQLRLEETLLRHAEGSWLLLNDGVGGLGGDGRESRGAAPGTAAAAAAAPDAAAPVCVVGVSGKVPELLRVRQLVSQNATAVRRFTGGGTVVADADTLMASLIVDGERHAPETAPFPDAIMAHVGGAHASALRAMGVATSSLHARGGAREALAQSFAGFALRENDFAVDGRKYGGNAQYIARRRWVHHTSMLWDYQDALMDLLRPPRKQPEWRRGRGHGEFVCRLKEVLPAGATRGDFLSSLERALAESLGGGRLQVEEVALENAMAHAEELRTADAARAAETGRRVRPSGNKPIELRDFLEADDEEDAKEARLHASG